MSDSNVEPPNPAIISADPQAERVLSDARNGKITGEYPTGPRRGVGRLVAIFATLLVIALAASYLGGLFSKPRSSDSDVKIVKGIFADGLPPLVAPTFIAASQAFYLQSNDRVVGIVQGGMAKAYPLKILDWHEVVDDSIAGQPVAVTYCPLTKSAMVYNRELAGQRVNFSFTGKLYEGNSLLADSETKTLWSQAEGLAISGPLAGHRLNQTLAGMVTPWGIWRNVHPDTLVLAADRNLGNFSLELYPYDADPAMQFPLVHRDPRLPVQEMVVGVEIGDASIAFPYSNLRTAKHPPATARLAGKQVQVFFDPKSLTAIATVDGKREPYYAGYWYGWAAFHPGSALWGTFKWPPPIPVVFKNITPLSAPREGHTATLLKNDKVLLVGGDKGVPPMLKTALLYDPALQTVSPTGDLNLGRGGQTATLLSNGQVLIAGGDGDMGALDSAELYDPVAGRFKLLAPMNEAREQHTATLLRNGRVLIVGGNDRNGMPVAKAELFDPTTARFSFTGALLTPRYSHQATLLEDGTVLITGGSHNNSSLAKAELFDPGTGRFSPVGNLHQARQGHTATLLPGGKVLVAGGFSEAGILNTAELYDPATRQFSLNPGRMVNGRERQCAVLLPNGQVMLLGGAGAFRQLSLDTVELYNPATGRFSMLGKMTMPRFSPTATLLADGAVLVTGRLYAPGIAATEKVELYRQPQVARK